jgi:hypothetical protein
LPGSKPLLHPADMASGPIKADDGDVPAMLGESDLHDLAPGNVSS